MFLDLLLEPLPQLSPLALLKRLVDVLPRIPGLNSPPRNNVRTLCLFRNLWTQPGK